MSHKASYWLATIAPDRISPYAFRVLFHLCDAHNDSRDPETACFPGQDRLRARTGLSNGGLNNSLNALESAGLIRRRRTRNADGTKGPTYYILGCDMDDPQPTPPDGDGVVDPDGGKKPRGAAVDKSGANSISEPKPTPSERSNQLHAGGVYPKIDPKKEQGGRSDHLARLEARANLILQHKPFLCTTLSAVAAGECIAAGLVTVEDCRRSGIAL
ncbi:MAG: helix-turn-helix domain-containing protein [Rhodobacteraceae bacterium]|nr:helix-turn-helix domain-containing protein [Paracoccaceae bacterium]